MHIIGVISHGRQAYLKTCPSHIAQGHNVTIQAIYEVILDTLKKEGRLPPILHVQLDNTTKQCKGKFLLCFLAMLKAAGVFEQVQLGFLPVGHTHEDIDQLFSRISVRLRLKNAVSRLQLARVMQSSFKKYGKPPEITHWTSVANISEYLDDMNCLRDLIRCTDYHDFRAITLDGEPAIQVRSWPGSPPDCIIDHWRGLKMDTRHTKVFKANCKERPDLLRDIDSMPGAQRATHTKKMKQYKKGLVKKQKGIDVALEKFPMLFREEDIDDLQDVLKMECTPAKTDIPFNWKEEDIRKLFGDSDSHPEAVPAAGDGEDSDDSSDGEDSSDDSSGGEDASDGEVLGDLELVGDDDEDLEPVGLTLNKFYISRPNPGTYINFY